ncbi:MAG TPA: M3 family metallopeptidase [Steroidobacteraceae bacterium]|nr:M3 family metallopeptidase [Steroidobacteraceae bacterium]
MSMSLCKLVILLTAAFFLGGAARAQVPSAPAQPDPLAGIESAYADFNDALGAIGLIESGLRDSYQGRTRSEWVRLQQQAREDVQRGLESLAGRDLSAIDRRAIEIMRKSMADAEESGSLAPAGKCEDAQRKDIEYAALREALYACFGALSNSLDFEGAKVTRVGAFDLLTRMEEPERRRQLFIKFVPLWQAINGKNERDSPYRRVIAMAAERGRTEETAVDAAAKTVGASTAQVEKWLVQILDAWRKANDGKPMEPWDYRYRGGATERELGETIAREALQPINERFYRDLGAQLSAWKVIYDLDPRPGKAPLAYTDYVKRGRTRDGKWEPTLTRVSGNYARGGLGLINELVHENGHVVHMMALQTRPAFMDLGDPLFYEAFADVPSWSTYEPAWQQKYLGRSSAEDSSLRGLYATVMLDVAWALFELRMLRAPTQDPNAVWTDITSRYLNVIPHPELSWWLVRVQLVNSPGYMVNYGLGAVVTADIRQRIATQLGPFDTGNERWFSWLSQNLLSSGYTHETAELLRGFLGRPVSPQALLTEIGRMQKKKN